jgi:hypothetical protein
LEELAIYVATYLDDYSGYSGVELLETKGQVNERTQQVFTELETQKGASIKRVRSDNGREYVNNVLGDYFKNKGIIHEKTTVYTL